MIELPLIFAAGFLGSSHCIGMCGPFAIMLGSGSGSWHNNLARQGLFSAGRIFTYSMLGALAGFGGMRLSGEPTFTRWVNVPAVLSVVAGCFLVYQGLVTTGIFSRGRQKTAGAVCLAGGIVANFLKGRNLFDAFLAGLFTGFLPCGLVYGFLGLAASSQHILSGAVMMFAFGLGTVPVMTLTGLGGGLLSATHRARILHVAAWCLVVAGAISIARGIGYLAGGGEAACPFCV